MDIPADNEILTTPSGKHTVTFRRSLTGKDKRDYRRVLIGLTDKSGTGEALDEAENALIRMAVHALDDTNDQLIERLEAFPIEDYDWVLDQVNDIAQGLTDKKSDIQYKYEDFFQGKSVRLTEEMVWLELCLQAGLSYEEYIRQPLWIIETHWLRFLAGGT